jgi:predicted kinase
MPHLTIIRGLPGSGKSTYARELNALHLEADMFYVNNGVYTFDHTKIGQAHQWCRMTTASALSAGMDVVVSNTFTQLWELKPYFRMPFDTYEVLKLTGDYGSIHNVPEESIEKVKRRWEDFDGETVL